MEQFKDYALYYDLMYREKNYLDEAVQIDSLIKNYSEYKCEKLINFGCGTGKHDFELSNLGYKMSGIDLSADMIEIAKKEAIKRNLSERFEIADVRNYFASEKYDAVISIFHVMSYQNSNDDLRKAFQSARNCMNTGGVFIFDSWYGPGVLTDLPSIRVKKVSDDNFDVIRIATPKLFDQENRVDVNYDIFVTSKKDNKTQEIKECHHMRYLFRPEVELLLSSAGFELIDVLDCKTMKKTNYQSWTAYFIARAK